MFSSTWHTREGSVTIAEQIAAIEGIILSLAFSSIPGLRQKYERPADEIKRLIMLGLLVLLVAGVFELARPGAWFPGRIVD